MSNNGEVQSTSIQKAEQAQVAPVARSMPLVPTNLEEAWRLATALSKSTLVPDAYREQPSNIMTAIMMGADLGISTTQAMREVYVVKGRPSTSALLKVALVLQSPLCEYWQLIESTDTQATFETKRRGAKQPTRHTYTLDEAKKADLYPGQNDSSWRKRPKLMLRRRCESELADEVYPDVVKGLRTEDEAQEIEREAQGSRIFVESTEAPPLPPPEPKASERSSEPRAPREIVQEMAATPESKPAVQETTSASGAPDPVDVFLAELAQAASVKDVDAMSKRAGELAPKGHPRRNDIGKAMNEARRRLS